MKKIGEILKNAREDSDLTQLEVMKKTGINNKTLSGYENGIAEPDVETMVTLFNFYGVSADEVLEIKTCKDGKILLSVSEEEREMLSEFRKLSRKKRNETLLVLKTLNNLKQNKDN